MPEAAIAGATLPAAESRSSSQETVTFGLGLLLPILSGGNVLFLLDPEPAFTLFTLAAVGATAIFAANRRCAPSWALVSPLVVFIAWTTATFLLRPSGPRAGGMASAFAVAALLHVAFSMHPPTAAELRRFVLGLLGGVLVTVAYGQYQYWEMFPRITPIIIAAGRPPFLFVNANFYNANCYAPFLAAVVLCAVPLLRREETLPVRAFVATSIAAMMGTLFLTKSRSTIAFLAVAFGVAALARHGWKVLRSLALGFAALVVIALTTVDLEELWRVGTGGRLRIFQGAGAMIADNWLFGVGLGLFGEAFYRYRVNDYYTRYPHNFWLEIFAELGIVAIVAITLFLVFALVRAARAWAASGDDEGSGLRRGAALAAMLLVAHASVDIDWHAPANPLLLFLLLAITSRPSPAPGT